jgi:uncharacterized protein YndB with AHSA1/START domain
MPQEKNKEPVQQSVHVDCSPEEAFRLFTEFFSEWWPLADNAQIEPWEGGQVLGGKPGTVTTWDPPHRLELTWNAQQNETVEAVFSRENDGTRVTLTHAGWQGAGIEICSLAASAISHFAEFVLELLVMA